MRRIACSTAVLLALAACGGDEQARNGAGEATITPTTYGIRQADLGAMPPKDICRTRDPSFLQNLVGRVTRTLPPAEAATIKIRDFNVTDGYEGKGREATLRFTVDRLGDKTLFYARGAFTKADCKISDLRLGAGPAPNGLKETRVP